MDNSVYKESDSWFPWEQPPYPPAHCPVQPSVAMQCGGKGEPNADIRQSISQPFVTRVCGLGSVNAYRLITDSPFPSACVGERAGVRGVFRSSIFLLLLIAL